MPSSEDKEEDNEGEDGKNVYAYGERCFGREGEGIGWLAIVVGMVSICHCLILSVDHI